MADPNLTPAERIADALERIAKSIESLTFNLTNLDGKPVIILTDEGEDVT